MKKIAIIVIIFVFGMFYLNFFVKMVHLFQ